jgi:hypothetical protein
MNDKNEHNINGFNRIALVVLFVTSYIPLFILVILKQVSENRYFLIWGGFNRDAILLCIQKFGFSMFLCLISILGLLGIIFTFKKLEKDSKNGDNVITINVSNKNNESVGYIATYIVPFLSQNFNGLYEIITFVFLMMIIYSVYINSNMILINPILNLKYSIFQIEYREQNGKEKNGLVIIKSKYLMEEAYIKIYPIGFKLYYVAKS